MQIIGNLFTIIIFLSFMGSIFAVVSLVARKVLHFSLPLWFGIFGIIFFLIPLIMPSLWLVYPSESVWIESFILVFTIWFYGVLALGTYYAVRFLLVLQSLKTHRICKDERINNIYSDCLKKIQLKKTPVIYLGTFKYPACVVTAFSPFILLDESIVKELSNEEIRIILCHELMHIKRKHHVFQRIYDLVSVLHWLNPFVWIAKNDFAALCESDCDKAALTALDDTSDELNYVKTMIHLLELSANKKKFIYSGALSFFVARQRINFILSKPSILKKSVTTFILTVLVILTISFSAVLSCSYFYPYPSYSKETEYNSNTQ